jgi:nitrogen fixation NifU-like protein
MSYKDPDIRRQLILEHYENPLNKVKQKQMKNYVCGRKDSPSCIDNITAFIRFDGDRIVDLKFTGIGCAIATSSTDLMAQALKNKTLDQAQDIIKNYLAMIDGKKFNLKTLEALTIYDNLHKQLNRINCGKVGI